jgi:hypothetical protein
MRDLFCAASANRYSLPAPPQSLFKIAHFATEDRQRAIACAPQHYLPFAVEADVEPARQRRCSIRGVLLI